MSKPSTIIFVILIFALVISIFSVGLYDTADQYGVAVDGNYSDYFTKVNSTFESLDAVSGEMQNETASTENPSEEGGITMTGSIVKAIKLPFQALGLVPTLLTSTADVLGIPNWIVYVFITIITLAVTVAVVSMFTGRET
jgi:hypothetical protein